MNEEAITIDEDEEAQYIQDWLLNNKVGFIDTDSIKAIIFAQQEYMVTIGLSVPIEEQ